MQDKLRILLVGEYSNVHWTLAQGLRKLGHEVNVLSDGDGWKNYPRDIDLKRQSMLPLDTLLYICKLIRILPTLKGYDVVQLINPIFFDLKAERMWRLYRILKQQNKKIFLGAFGMDHYWVKAGMDCKTFRYSDFNMGSELRRTQDALAMEKDWLQGKKAELNQFIAQDCNGIISGLYEYDASYRPYYADKMQFIPFPIRIPEVVNTKRANPLKINFFIGIQRNRDAYKGTDIMYRALLKIQQRYPDQVEIKKAENVPFAEYQQMLSESDVLLDQLYSYTPAMNGLLAMSRGLVLVGGGEPEQYEILGEKELFPIVNVEPNEDSVYHALDDLVQNPDQIEKRKHDGVEYIRRHHEYVKVAQQYINFWNER